MKKRNNILSLLVGCLVSLNLTGQTNQPAQVDPLTGDFSYGLPVLSIPSPNGAFDLTLSYNPNVYMLQEASWVGLGWDLSAGKITRNVNVFPDDFQGEIVHTTASSGGTYPLFTHDGQGNILKEWSQPYTVQESKAEKMFGSLYMGEVANSNQQEIDYPAYDPQSPPPHLYEQEALVPFVRHGPNWYRSPHYEDLNVVGAIIPPVGDVYFHQPKGYDPSLVVAPTHIAFDDYLVSAPGVAGRIKPYRPEVGTVTLSYAQSTNSPFIRRDYFSPWLRKGNTNYDKMGFYYDGQTVNHHSHHLGSSTPSSMEITTTLNNLVNSTFPKMYFEVDDVTLSPTSTTRIESRVDGSLIDNLLTAGKHIRWFTNNEYENGTAYTEAGAIDVLQGSASTIFRNAKPAEGIGGFVITNEDGYTYHFSLPVMRKNQTAVSFEEGAASNSNLSAIPFAYATEWLLTAITGPDFVDLGTPGFIDGIEEGFWVVFDYGLFTANFATRTPYDGNYRTLLRVDPPDIPVYQATHFTAEVEKYYLNSIRTASHTALFVKSVREDSRGFYDYSTPSDNPSSCMRLEQVLLFDNETLNTIPLNLANTAGENGDLAGEASYNGVLDSYDWPASYDALYEPINRIKFNQNYALATGSPNSFPNPNSPPTTSSYGNGGKLTLNSLEIHGKGTTSPTNLEGKYQFVYHNGTYDVNDWDGWGYPISSVGFAEQGSIFESHLDVVPTLVMHRIVDPLGAETNIEYERDAYSNVAGNAVVTDGFGTIVPDRIGGGFRVKLLTTTDPHSGEQYESRFIYTTDGTETGLSSGAMAIEPVSRPHDYPIYESYDWKQMPVMYERTTILKGYRSLTDYLEKSVHEHVVPHQNMVLTQAHIAPDFNYNFGFGGFNPPSTFKKANFRLHVTTSTIGNTKSVKRYSPKGHLLMKQEYHYDDPLQFGFTDPGVYTEGSILSELSLSLGPNMVPGVDDKFIRKLFRTTKVYYPNRLRSITTTENEVDQSITFVEFDPITGLPIVTDARDELGTVYRERQVPAYTVIPYGTMGSKVTNSDYSNQLSEIAGKYQYYINPAGAEELLDVDITTWKKGGNYRNLSGGIYSTVAQNDVWRSSQQFKWENLLNDNGDGTFNETLANTRQFVAFDYNALSNNDPDHWRATQEVTLLDGYSTALEVRDVNGNFQSVKKGYDDELVIAEATNARYTEFYFCGAEDPNSFSGYFGGEVHGAAYAHESDVYAHTGKRSLQLNSGDQLPLVRDVSFGTASTDDLSEQTYVASIWVHKENAANMSLYYKLFNGATAGPAAYRSISSSNTVKAGNWYLVTLEIPLANPAFGAYNKVEVGVEISTSCTGGNCQVYCDDFRMQPQAATMNAYVYEPDTWRRIATLDNDNFATKTTYDAQGRVTRESREQADRSNLIGGFKKVQENTYHNHTQ